MPDERNEVTFEELVMKRFQKLTAFATEHCQYKVGIENPEESVFRHLAKVTGERDALQQENKEMLSGIVEKAFKDVAEGRGSKVALPSTPGGTVVKIDEGEDVVHVALDDSELIVHVANAIAGAGECSACAAGEFTHGSGPDDCTCAIEKAKAAMKALAGFKQETPDAATV